MQPHLDTMVNGMSLSSQNFLKSMNPSVKSTGLRPSVAMIVCKRHDQLKNQKKKKKKKVRARRIK